jgi:hypothetical protein
MKYEFQTQVHSRPGELWNNPEILFIKQQNMFNYDIVQIQIMTL